MIKVLNVWWYGGNVGIIKVDTGFEIKYYIGAGYGKNEEKDIQRIVNYGDRFYPEIFEWE